MPPKAQAKPGDSKKLKAMEYKHKNPLHKAELARLLKIARGPKYNINKFYRLVGLRDVHRSLVLGQKTRRPAGHIVPTQGAQR